MRAWLGWLWQRGNRPRRFVKIAAEGDAPSFRTPSPAAPPGTAPPPPDAELASTTEAGRRTPHGRAAEGATGGFGPTAGDAADRR